MALPINPRSLDLRSGCHGVVILANYLLNELITDVHSPPDMLAYSFHFLSIPVGPNFQRAITKITESSGRRFQIRPLKSMGELKCAILSVL